MLSLLLLSSSAPTLLGTEDAESVASGQLDDYLSNGKKGNTSIEIHLSLLSVQIGTTVHATGVLRGTNSERAASIGNALLSLSVILPDGSISYPTQGRSITSASNGYFSIDYAPVVSGVHSFQVTFSGSRSYSNSTSIATFVSVEAPPILNEPSPVLDPGLTLIPTVISLSGSSTIIVGDVQNITGLLKTNDDTPIRGASVLIQVAAPDGGKINSSAPLTDANGEFSYSFVPSVAGSFTLSATYAGNASYDATLTEFYSTVIVPTPMKSPSSITISIESSTVQTGSNAHATGSISGLPNPSGAIIELIVTCPDGSIVTPVQGAATTVDASGDFSIDYSPRNVGAYTFTATYPGDWVSLGSSASTSFAVIAPEPQPPADQYDFTIEGNIIRAFDGSVAYSGIEATSTIQWAIDHCIDGGKIFIEAGIYSIACPTKVQAGGYAYMCGIIVHNKALTLQGAGMGNTILRLADGQFGSGGKEVGTIMLIVDGTEGMIIDGMTWDGNRAGNPSTPSSWVDGSACIYTWGWRHNNVYSNLEICNSPDTGLYLGNNYRADSGPGYGPGWEIGSLIASCYFHDNYHIGLMHDACQDCIFENIVSERDAPLSMRGIYIEGNTDYLSRPNDAILRNITLKESDIRFYNVKNVNVSHLLVDNPTNAEMGGSIEITESASVHIQIDGLIRENVRSGQGYGVVVGYMCPDTQIMLSGVMVAKIGVALVNLGYEVPFSVDSTTSLTFVGGTIMATEKGIYSTGSCTASIQNVYFDVPAARYNLYVADMSRMDITESNAARATLAYVAPGASLFKDNNGPNI